MYLGRECRPSLFPVVVFGRHGGSGLESRGPMHEVKVYVVQSQVLERGIKGWLDGFGTMRVVPELRGDE